MKVYNIEILGTTPLMHHRMTEEDLFKLLGNKDTKKKVKGEKTPRQIAEEHAYKDDDGTYFIPMDYISGAFANVASDYKQTNSARKSYKSIAQGIFRPTSTKAPLLGKKEEILDSFEVDVRKATNHQKGAVAVCRPRFDEWKVKFQVAIDDTIISPEMALTILQDAGKRAGIGSFRVCKGGYFGQFVVTHFKEALEERE